jgi:hypothetical protein
LPDDDSEEVTISCSFGDVGNGVVVLMILSVCDDVAFASIVLVESLVTGAFSVTLDSFEAAGSAFTSIIFATSLFVSFKPLDSAELLANACSDSL